MFHYVLKIKPCSQIGSIIVHTLSKTFTEVLTFSEVLEVRCRPVDFRFIADQIALKVVIHNKIVLRAGMGSCLPKLKSKRNSRCVAVIGSFVLINVSKIKARCSPVQFTAANEKSSIHSSKRNKKQRRYNATKQNGII